MDSSHLSRFIYFADDNFGTNNVGALVGFIVGLVLLCLFSFLLHYARSHIENLHLQNLDMPIESLRED